MGKRSVTMCTGPDTPRLKAKTFQPSVRPPYSTLPLLLQVDHKTYCSLATMAHNNGKTAPEYALQLLEGVLRQLVTHS